MDINNKRMERILYNSDTLKYICDYLNFDDKITLVTINKSIYRASLNVYSDFWYSSNNFKS